MGLRPCFVVRTDIGTKTTWLKSALNAWPNCSTPESRNYVTTRNPRKAAGFATAERAQQVADAWSDFPGVWRVVVRAPTHRQIIHKWDCPIGHPGCERDCGNYGCGN